LTGLPPIVGVSYLFLRGWDLIRRAQRGLPPPTLVHYLNQMTFFPAFAAGPIAGPEPFEQGFAPTRASVAAGFNRILTGLAKFAVIAPLLEPAHLLGPPQAASAASSLSCGQVWFGVYASTLWIYFNFAGYSDIAIGTGLLCGIKLPENFEAPYLAASPTEFWQRWHVSFTQWLREHVFSPTSRLLVRFGLERSAFGVVAGVTATMVACAIWHRPSIEFLAWGLYHAAVTCTHQLYATRLKPRLAAAGLGPFFGGRAYRVLGILATFHAVAIGWVLFMPLDAPLRDHLAILRRLFP
jgi:alginate O-acetyltransferase complex protein AlgI